MSSQARRLPAQKGVPSSIFAPQLWDWKMVFRRLGTLPSWSFTVAPSELGNGAELARLSTDPLLAIISFSRASLALC